MKNKIIKFDDFINPHAKKFINKKIKIDTIFPCSYVRYIIIDFDEIKENIFIIEYNEEILKKHYYGQYIIYAINYLDNIICEVIW